MNRPYKCPMYTKPKYHLPSSLSLSLRLDSSFPSLSLSPSLIVPRRTLPLLRAPPPSLPHAAPPSPPRGDGQDLPILRAAAPSGGARRRTPLFSAWRHSAAHPRVAGVLGHGLPAVARGSVPSSSAGSHAGARPPPPVPAARGTLSPSPQRRHGGGGHIAPSSVARKRALPIAPSLSHPRR